jgi:hypothetical protein
MKYLCGKGREGWVVKLPLHEWKVCITVGYRQTNTMSNASGSF